MKRSLKIILSIIVLIGPPQAFQTIPKEEQKRIDAQQLNSLREDFRPARELLSAKSVPFDPEILLEPDWQQRLRPVLSQMSELKTSKQLGAKISGLQMADVLYLPEKVAITGNTVLLANKIVFEGKNAVIQGHYAVYFYPAVTEGILGSSLSEAMAEAMARDPSLADPALSFEERLNRFTPALAQNNWSLTINTSGAGREEWLEKEKRRKGLTTTLDTITDDDDQDTSGRGGRPGVQGPYGDPGQPGQPSPAGPGYPAFCGVNRNGGGNGENGENGGEGGRPSANGGEGEPGGDAGPIVATVASTTGTHRFFAKGGDGGDGGQGGTGGDGGIGGQGGPGANGADCSCAYGGPGNGGNGGRGGKGGLGGNGSDGGLGGMPGNGANITITRPANLVFRWDLNSNGGRGGMGGRYGDGGRAGLPGQGGNPGQHGSSFNCSGSDASDGLPGLVTGTFGNGNTGQWGPSRSGVVGTTGEIRFIDSPPTGGGNGGGCNFAAALSGITNTSVLAELRPSTCCSSVERISCTMNGGTWLPESCSCVSPIVIDVAGDGVNLTNAADGVRFDISNTGQPIQVSWTAANSDDSWLVLDRNRNGRIDDGRELFGSATRQPYLQDGEVKNGFRALAVFDRPGMGGNNDGVIDTHDSVFSDLRLWRDINHNGISEPEELKTLTAVGLRTLDLNYTETRRRDENGNWFRFRAKVRDAQGSQLGRWAWDVFLQVAP